MKTVKQKVEIIDKELMKVLIEFAGLDINKRFGYNAAKLKLRAEKLLGDRILSQTPAEQYPLPSDEDCDVILEEIRKFNVNADYRERIRK